MVSFLISDPFCFSVPQKLFMENQEVVAMLSKSIESN